MKDIRCLFGRHEFTGWVEIEQVMTGKCSRCGKAKILDYKKIMKFLSEKYPEAAIRYKEIYDQIDEFRQSRKCTGVTE